MADAGDSLPELLWGFAPDPAGRPAPRSMADVPATTPESAAMAKELKRRGFRFVGPTTAYALMQACGLVNDHLAGCCARCVTSASRSPRCWSARRWRRCGGSDADDRRAPAPRLSDAEQAAATVRRQMQAVARGDGETACGLFSPAGAARRPRREVSRRAGSIGCATAVEQGAAALRGGVRARSGARRSPGSRCAATRATVQRAAAGRCWPAARTARLPLRRIGGGWRVDGLPPL